MCVVIYSSNYHPAHAQHMHAYALALHESGLSVVLWASDAYFTNHSFLRKFPRSSPEPFWSIIVLNMSLQTVIKSVLWRMKKRKILFCVHEPIGSLRDFQDLDLPPLQFVKLLLMRILIKAEILLSSQLIAFSKKSVKELRGIKPTFLHPLIYVDQNSTGAAPLKKFLSYIGTIAKDHAFNEFVGFVDHCLTNDLFPDLRFLIATRSDFDPHHFDRQGAEKAARVVIKSGHMLSDSEINIHYAASAVIWCAYKRSNQSGVLPKAYMFGVPVVATEGTMGEHFEAGQLGAAITSYEMEPVADAVSAILRDYNRLSKNCRNYYKSTFDYKANVFGINRMVLSNE